MENNNPPAIAPEWVSPIKVEIVDTVKHIGRKCHVEGWNFGCVFKLINSDGKNHTIKTPKTGKIFMTKNKLLYLRGKSA